MANELKILLFFIIVLVLLVVSANGLAILYPIIGKTYLSYSITIIPIITLVILSLYLFIPKKSTK